LESKGHWKGFNENISGIISIRTLRTTTNPATSTNLGSRRNISRIENYNPCHNPPGPTRSYL